MRTLSLVDCLELKFTGSILKEALCFGDVDNDGVSEFVVGNSDGELFIFKFDKCICRAFDLGCIAAVAVGDLLNIGRNFTVVITTEGYCHVFDVEDELKSPPEVVATGSSALGDATAKNGGGGGGDGLRVIQQFHSQRIVANTKAIFLADVDDDGKIELVCGLTDRVLRTYKWNPNPILIAPTELVEGQQENPTFPHAAYEGRVQAINKWELTNQIGSIAPHAQGNLVSIIIGTGGGTVTRITEVRDPSRIREEMISSSSTNPPTEIFGSVGCRLEMKDSISTTELQKQNVGGSDDQPGLNTIYSENISIKRHALNSSRMRNQNISTHVAGNIASHDGTDTDSYAVGTWDGTVMICKDDMIEWNLQLNKPVMTVQSFMGSAIFVDMEGPTYLINRRIDSKMQNCILRFYFEEQVAAFRVGLYGMRRTGGSATPTNYEWSENEKGSENEILNHKCFVYVTFQGDIYIYPNEFL